MIVDEKGEVFIWTYKNLDFNQNENYLEYIKKTPRQNSNIIKELPDKERVGSLVLIESLRVVYTDPFLKDIDVLNKYT